MNNYKQALEILQSTPAMELLYPNASAAMFNAWLSEEYAYLSTKTTTPLEEQWKIDYYRKLVLLQEHECAGLFNDGYLLTAI